MNIQKIKNNPLVKDGFWAVGGSVILRGLSMLSGIILARFLGSSDYGAFTTLKGFLLTITTFSTLGIGYTATKFFAQYINKNESFFYSLYKYLVKLTFGFSLIIGVILFFISSIFAQNFLKEESLDIPVKILAISIIFNAVSFSQIGIISGLKKFKELSFLNLIIGIISFIITLGLTYFFGFYGSVYSLLIVSILNFLFNEIFLRRVLIKPQFNSEVIDVKLKKHIIKESIPIALQEISYSVTSWISPILLIKYSSYSDVANYNIVMQWNAIILFIPGALRNVVLSHLSISNNEISKRNKVLNQTILLNLIMTLIPAFIIFLARNFIADIYGENYINITDLIGIAVFITIPLSISNIYSQAFMSVGKNWLMLIIRTLRDLSILLVFLIFVNRFTLISSKSMLFSALIINSLSTLLFVVIYKKMKLK